MGDNGGVAGDPAIVPSYQELLWPTLQATVALGGSGTIEEIDAKVLERGGFTEEQQAVLHGDGPKTKITYRLSWARSHLKGIGALTNSKRGVWTATELGRKMNEEEVSGHHGEYRSRRRQERRERRRQPEMEGAATVDGTEDDEVEERDWKELLLERLVAMPPGSFERLAQRLLREAGFVSANVTGRSGDGGIDGLGVYRLSLVSFPVFFQCKRYSGSVGPAVVRDFRGAMAGRGDKGLLITTGTFTSDARKEATRDGAPPIDLIDGEQLCDLLRRHGLGVRVTPRTIEDVEVEEAFFEQL